MGAEPSHMWCVLTPFKTLLQTSLLINFGIKEDAAEKTSCHILPSCKLIVKSESILFVLNSALVSYDLPWI